MKEQGSVSINPFESLTPLTRAEETVLMLVYFRDDWEREKLNREYSKTDGHAQFFIGLAACLGLAKEERILPKKILKKVDKFLDWYTDDFGNRHEYPIIDRPKEIEETKYFIQNIINSFKPLYPEEGIISKEVLRKRFELHKTWFGGVPRRIVHSIDGPWKIRTGWFAGIAWDLYTAREENFLPQNILDDVDNFFEWWETRDEVPNNHLNTNEDIGFVDNLIENFLRSPST